MQWKDAEKEVHTAEAAAPLALVNKTAAAAEAAATERLTTKGQPTACILRSAAAESRPGTGF